MLSATSGIVLVLYYRVFKPSCNNPDLEALEPLAGKSSVEMNCRIFSEGVAN
jgi:hypothetical protein